LRFSSCLLPARAASVPASCDPFFVRINLLAFPKIFLTKTSCVSNLGANCVASRLVSFNFKEPTTIHKVQEVGYGNITCNCCLTILFCLSIHPSTSRQVRCSWLPPAVMLTTLWARQIAHLPKCANSGVACAPSFLAVTQPPPQFSLVHRASFRSQHSQLTSAAG
jgi:hypothetical protein